MTPPAGDQQPEGTDLAVELRKGRHVRASVLAIFVAVLLLVVGALAYDRIREERACDRAWDVREHSEELDLRLFRQLGVRLNATEDEIEDFLAVIHHEYATMPEPAACGERSIEP